MPNSGNWLFRASTFMMAVGCAALAQAEDISTKKLSIKDNADPAKRQVQVQSGDAGVAFAEAGNPSTDGAAIHVYSATDDFCVVLPAGPEWQNTGSSWKYTNKATKNGVQFGDGKLSVKLKSGVDFSLADDAGQGSVEAQVQLGNGTRYCMRCDEPTKDDAKTFSAKSCVAAACSVEPSPCEPSATTTTTSTTTTTNPPPLVLMGALVRANGRFNYNMTLGIPGSDAACNTNFPGTHTCNVTELLAAEAAGDLDGLKDTGGTTVTSFWAIDSLRPDTAQCHVTIAWDYATAHTGHAAEKMDLNNATGDLAAVTASSCANQRWVGCCQ